MVLHGSRRALSRVLRSGPRECYGEVVELEEARPSGRTSSPGAAALWGIGRAVSFFLSLTSCVTPGSGGHEGSILLLQLLLP